MFIELFSRLFSHDQSQLSESLELLHLNLVISEPDKIDDIQQSHQIPMKDWMDKNFSEIKKISELNDSWSYGWRLYNFNGINQIEWIIEKLKKKPESKRV